jgi:tricorn protease
MKNAALLLLAFMLVAICNAQPQDTHLLLQEPTLNRTHIVFVYGGELWRVGRNGGDAVRLTTGVGVQSHPSFSPDGSMIAFSGQYGGNTDVYVIPAEGGIPKRLTYHPVPDTVVGWSHDGKGVLFTSPRDSFASGVSQLFIVPVTGGLPSRIPLPTAYEGSYSPDGTHLAYGPVPHAFGTWSHYRGGTETKIWMANLADSSVQEVPRGDWNDCNPMWVGNKIYYLSDQKGPYALFEYDTATKKTGQVIPNDGLPIKSASAGPGAIVYEQFGTIHLYDLSTHREHAVPIQVAGDFPQVLPHFDSVESHILTAGISPTGVRAVFEAHGEILTVPAEKGDIRNVTNTPKVADRSPAWSPDGKSIAWFSDESGEYALHISDQKGMSPVRKISLAQPPSFFYDPLWSPDSKKIAYTDKRLNVWYVDIDKGSPIKIDTDTYETPERLLNPSWSPDSRWIAYTKILPNHMRAVFLYSLETGKSSQITDGMSDAEFAVFDKDGKYLYFTASTNIGQRTAWLDMSSYDHTITRHAYVVVLRKDLPSPLAPESDEEKVAGSEKKEGEAATAEKGKEPEKKEEVPKVTIDLDGISQRILALPVPARNYVAMEAGKTGELYLAELPPGESGMEEGPGRPPGLVLYKFELKTRKTESLLSGIQDFDVSFNGEKFLYHQGEHWGIAATKTPVKAGEGLLKMTDMKVWVDPRAEWSQMYKEVWRIERDFFYDPHLHGLNLAQTEAEYAKYLPELASREDLNYLFNQMLSDLNVGHMFVGGGAIPRVPSVNVGLLGADFAVENGRYRISRVYSGENWNPGLHAPLTQPGVNVTAGDYILAVDGRELQGSDNIYSFFLDKANKQVVLKVGPNPDSTGSRDVTVVPISSESALRNRDWIVGNMNAVDRLSDGKLAYVYLPNTAGAGFTNFNRYYFAQVNRPGAVIDERFNGGGSVANYMIETMQRKLTSYWYTREGGIFSSPLDAIFGPKVMITNQFAGSGGDWLPWAFRHVGLGALIGEKTWGGLVGIYDYPQLIDGGFVTAPRVAFFNPNGTWDVENHGVPPDIPVLLDPHAWREGHDAQLEKAVAVALEELKKAPLPVPHLPAFPDYSKWAR